MKQARVLHIINTFTEIMEGYRVLGSPLSDELLNLCPGEIKIDLLKGDVRTKLEKKELVSKFVEPFIEYLKKEIVQDKGLPHIEKCEVIFTLGNPSKFSKVEEVNCNFDVKKNSVGQSYRTQETRFVKYFGREYDLVMQGFIMHGNKKHNFSNNWQMKIQEGREEPG